MINYEQAKYTYFPSRQEMLQYATNFLTHKYKEKLLFMIAMDEKEQYGLSEKLEIARLEEALNKILGLVTCVFKNINIPPKGLIFKIAFKMAKITRNPTDFFPQKQFYRIEQNSFVEYLLP